MGDSIHGHEVLHLMLEHGGGYTRESLRDAMIARFGADARFHTCSADDLTADQLIEFLAARGKFVAGEDGFNTHPRNTCNH
jgi:probable metal-binding protein